MIEPSADQTVQGSHDWRHAGNKAGFDHIVTASSPSAWTRRTPPAEFLAKDGKTLVGFDVDIAKAVQAALQKLMDDGTYMKILKHWGVENGAIDKAEINPTDLG